VITNHETFCLFVITQIVIIFYSFYSIFDIFEQIDAALVSIRDFFQKHKNITDCKLCSTYKVGSKSGDNTGENAFK